MRLRRGAVRARPSNPGVSTLRRWPPSTSGLGHHPFKVAARVRIPLGASDSAARAQSSLEAAQMLISPSVA